MSDFLKRQQKRELINEYRDVMEKLVQEKSDTQPGDTRVSDRMYEALEEYDKQNDRDPDSNGGSKLAMARMYDQTLIERRLAFQKQFDELIPLIATNKWILQQAKEYVSTSPELFKPDALDRLKLLESGQIPQGTVNWLQDALDRVWEFSFITFFGKLSKQGKQLELISIVLKLIDVIGLERVEQMANSVGPTNYSIETRRAHHVKMVLHLLKFITRGILKEEADMKEPPPLPDLPPLKEKKRPGLLSRTHQFISSWLPRRFS